MIINDKYFDLDKNTYIMGILNVTPDSFSDGGEHFKIEDAINHAGRMLEEGAHIIDVGGESTRPGFIAVSEEEEIERVCTVIEKIRDRYDAAISIDTYKPKVAKAAIEAGAGMVNDICGFRDIGKIPTEKKLENFDKEIKLNRPKKDEDYIVKAEELEKTDVKKLKFNTTGMEKVVKESGVAVCLMHNRAKGDYKYFLSDVEDDLFESLGIAKKADIETEQICIDPGFGFAKNYKENITLLHYINHMNTFGLPILVGTSRKSFIGKALDLDVDERLEGTLATAAYAFLRCNARIFRVHDVKEHVRLVKMLETIMKI